MAFSWSDLAGALGGLSNSGMGSKLGGAIGGVFGPVGSAIGSGIGGLAQDVAGLFQTSDEGRAKIEATKQQQFIEQTALSVQKMVEQGQMDPATGMQQIRNLISMANNLFRVGDAATVRGMATAMHTLNNIYGNLTNNYKSRLGYARPTTSLSQISQDPQMQQDWMRAQMRNKLMGLPAGNQALSGSPLERVFKPAFDPLAAVSEAFEKAKNVLPSFESSPEFDRIRQKLGRL